MKKKRVLKTETLIKKTRKRFPDARIVRDEYGLYYIMDMHDEDIFELFMIPHQETERLAWEMGQLTARTDQNFNRTHPLKVDLAVEDSERRTNRLRKRNNPRIF